MRISRSARLSALGLTSVAAVAGIAWGGAGSLTAAPSETAADVAFSAVNGVPPGKGAPITSEALRAVPPGLGLESDRATEVGRTALKRVLAVPSKSGPPCLITTSKAGVGGTCQGTKNGPIAEIGPDGSIGIVPDSVKTVTYVLTDGTTKTAPVIKNTWQAPLNAKAARYTVANETINVELVPADEALPPGTSIDENGVIGPTGRTPVPIAK